MNSDTRSQRLVVVGPNLPKGARATFHVHAEGCADLKRGWIAPHAREHAPYALEYTSRHAVEEDVYYFVPDEDPTYLVGDYQTEFYFAPCVTVPVETS